MRINIYNSVIAAADCNVLMYIICRLNDCGVTFQACSDLLGISLKKVQKIYTEKAEAVQKAQAQFTTETALPDRPKHSGFIAACTDHFARCRAIFSGLDWHSYCLAILLSNMHSPTKNFMRKSLGASLATVNQCIKKLTEIGAILSIQSRPKPILNIAQLAQKQQYIYSAEMHDIFKKLTNE
jgi:hypothetical protein